MTLEHLESLRDAEKLDSPVGIASKKLRSLLLGTHYPQCYPTRSYDGPFGSRSVLQEHLRWQFHRNPGDWNTDKRSLFDLLAPPVMAARLTNGAPSVHKLTLEFATLTARAAMREPGVTLSLERDSIIFVVRHLEEIR